MRIELTDHLTELITETIEAGRDRCPECGSTAPGDKLIVYFTVRGNRSRQHDGAFCCKQCHDIWHGLARRG